MSAGLPGPTEPPNLNEMTPIQQAARVAATLAMVILPAACGDSTGPDPDRERVALTTRDGSQAALIVQDADGAARSRIHFTAVTDNVPGNLPPFLLPVNDATIRAMSTVRWDATGSRLAVVLSAAFDQSEIVVMNADGSRQRTMSPNTQVITSDIAWSPDGSRIAYTLSTGPAISGIELLMTEVASSRVTQLTSGSGLGAAGVALAWSASSDAVLYSEITDTGPGPLFQRLSQVNRIDIDTGDQVTIASDVPGEIAGISTDGEWVLLLRRMVPTGSGFSVDVVIRRLADGQETVLTDSPEPVQWAAVTAGERQVLIASSVIEGGLGFRTLSIDGRSPRTLASVETQATRVDIAPSR